MDLHQCILTRYDRYDGPEGNLALVGKVGAVVDSKRDGHNDDEEEEEKLQLPPSVPIEKEKGEGVSDGDETAPGQLEPAVCQKVEG